MILIFSWPKFNVVCPYVLLLDMVQCLFFLCSFRVYACVYTWFQFFGKYSLTSQNFAKVSCHHNLILLTTVIFYGKDNRVPKTEEGAISIWDFKNKWTKPLGIVSANAVFKQNRTYGLATKAYSLIASMTSLRRIFEVRVYPWKIIGPPLLCCPSHTSTETSH